MATACDFCGKIRSTVYCRADAASLCLSCDRKVHGANALSKQHYRTLLCDGCTVQPAAFSCYNHKLSFCHNCDKQRHSNSPQHVRTSINYYRGCPSAEELTELWSSELDGLGCEVKQGSKLPVIGWVDSVWLDGTLGSLDLGLWRMEPSASPTVDLPSSPQRNSEVNTMTFDSEGSVCTMAKIKVQGQ